MRGGIYTMMHELMSHHSRKLYPVLSPHPFGGGSGISVPTAPGWIVSPGGVPIQPPHAPVPLIYMDPDQEKESIWGDEACDQPREIIFEFEGWSIERWKGATKSDCDWVTHFCPSFGWRYRTDQWTLMADEICGGCCQTVPEEIMGVWKLKNFDNLVSMDTARAERTPYIFTSSTEPDEDPYDMWAKASLR